MMTKRPYPGLRPFLRNESDIFFGREEHVDELLSRLGNTRFLAVVGPSGCGKSSLVRAGLIAGLETGFLVTAGSHWRIAQMRPGSRPLMRLATALLQDSVLGDERAEQADAHAFLHATLRRGPLGLVEVLNDTPLPDGTNLLLVVDQFEEVFRFHGQGGADEAAAFISLLLESCRHSDARVFVVITMRSDFIGDCAPFTGLPEAINEGQYLTPRLSREQQQMAITGPCRIFGGSIEPALVNRLLNDMGTSPDQLPLMQHLLMRMWDQASSESDQPLLTLEAYEESGTLTKALSNHADEIYKSLSADRQEIAQTLFRCLCDRGPNQRDTRHPTRLEDVAKVAGLSTDEVLEVVEIFRQPDCSFVTPPLGEPIFSNTVLDISHESLIRQWDRLNEWVRLEAESAKTYRFLEQSARLWKGGQAALWGSPNLDLALVWKEQEEPNKQWAGRYGGNFELALEFLDASEQSRQEQIKKREAQAEAELQQARALAAAQADKTRLQRWISMGLAVLLVLLIAGIWGYLEGWVIPQSSYFNSFVKKNGVSQGVGPLTADQMRHREATVEIIRQGRFGPVQKMRMVDGRGNLTSAHGVGTYLRLQEDDPTPFPPCEWEFVYDSQGSLVYEKAYDKRKQLVWGFVYSPRRPGEPVRAYFVGPDGFPSPQANSLAEFVEFDYSDEGYEISLHYFDRSHIPRQGKDRAYGQRKEVDKRGQVLKMISLGLSDEPMVDEVGNASMVTTYDEMGNTVEAFALDDSDQPTTVEDGWAIARFTYDEYGRPIEERYFDANDNPTLNRYGFHSDEITYNNDGCVTSVYFFDTEGHPTLHSHGYHQFAATCNEEGRQISNAFFSTDGKPTIIDGGFHRVDVTYGPWGEVTEFTYFDTEGSPVLDTNGVHLSKYQYDDNGNRIRWAFFDTSGEPALHKDGDHLAVAKYDKRGNTVEIAYFDRAEEPTIVDQGYHLQKKKYDDWDNLLEESFFGLKGEPVFIDESYHRFVANYDKNGNRIDWAYLGVGGEPTFHPDGEHRATATYDERGRRLEEAYFDNLKRSISIRQGYHKVQNSYDDRGNKVAWKYLGRSGEPTTLADGEHAAAATYDGRDRRTSVAYFDLKGQPTLIRQGYHRVQNGYDARGNQTTRAYFGTQGEPILHESGYHMVSTTYDERDRPVEASYFDTDKTPILNAEGHHKVRTNYDERGNTVRSAFFGISDEPISPAGFHFLLNTFDDRDNRIRWEFFDISGEPTSHRDGNHRGDSVYDDRDRQIETSYFDEEDAPTLIDEGYHRVKKTYDDYGREKDAFYFNEKGAPTLLPDGGYHQVSLTYDERGRLAEVAIFGTNNQPINASSGLHRLRFTYDDLGNRTMQRFDVRGVLLE